MRTRLVIGCMTGTSLDGLDVAAVEIEGEGLAMRAGRPRMHSAPLGGLGGRLRDLAEQRPTTAADIAGLAHEFALLHAEAARAVLAGRRPDLICVHGQTVYHKPPLSWQLFQPAPLARAMSCPVVSDLRQADLAGGGQGAPITPLADWVLYRELAREEGRATILNLGGFCNFTTLPAGEDLSEIRAGDVCACNQLLDALARAVLRAPFDENGAAAGAGKVHEEALEDLLGVMRSQGRPGRSLGTGDELTDWIARWRHQTEGADLARTACTGIAETAAERLSGTGPIYLAGGGAKNRTLAEALASACPAAVRPLEGGEAREAACFAVLGALCQDRVPITLPQVTGVAAPAPIAGVWSLP